MLELPELRESVSKDELKALEALVKARYNCSWTKLGADLTFLPNVKSVKIPMVTVQKGGQLSFNELALDLIRECIGKWEIELKDIKLGGAPYDQVFRYLHFDFAYSSWKELYLFPTTDEDKSYRLRLSHGKTGQSEDKESGFGAARLMQVIPGMPDYKTVVVRWKLKTGDRYFILEKLTQAGRKKRKTTRR